MMCKRYNLRLTQENQKRLKAYKDWLIHTQNIRPGDTVCLNAVLAAGFASGNKRGGHIEADPWEVAEALQIADEEYEMVCPTCSGTGLVDMDAQPGMLEKKR